VGLKSLKSLNLTNGYPNKNNNNNNNNKVKSKPLELFELAGKKELELYENISCLDTVQRPQQRTASALPHRFFFV
jgi:hypothetical protein